MALALACQEKFEEKCAICQDVYKRPRLLPCLHSFCTSCLLKLTGGYKSTLKCPLCRSNQNLPTNGVDGFLPNTQLETYSVSMVKQKCGQCTQSDVVSYCVECDELLCTLCDEAHKRMAIFKNHKCVCPTQAAIEKKLKPKVFNCPQHSKEILDIYCTVCKIAVCRDCIMYCHKDHKVKPAEESIVEIKGSLKSLQKELKTQLTKFQSHAQSITKVEIHVTTYPDTMKAFIISHFDKLGQVLAQRKQSLLKEVDKQYNTFSKTIWAEKNIVETTISMINAGIKFADQIIAGEDKIEVAVLGTQALQSINQTKSLSWNPSKIENLGPLAYVPTQSRNVEDLIKNLGEFRNDSFLYQESTHRLTWRKKGYCSTSSSIAQRLKDNIPVYSQDLLNCPLSIYGHYTASYENGRYWLEAEYIQHRNCKTKPLFPELFIQAIVVWKGQKAIASSCLPRYSGSNTWEISFKTEEVGDYDIFALLQMVNGEILKVERIRVTLSKH